MHRRITRNRCTRTAEPEDTFSDGAGAGCLAAGSGSREETTVDDRLLRSRQLLDDAGQQGVGDEHGRQGGDDSL